MRFRNAVWRELVAFLATATVATISCAQGIPETQWTASERDFVSSARALYGKQGMPYTDAQAATDVQRIREAQKPKTRGVPKSEWTQQEQALVETIRPQYIKAFGAFTDEQAQLAVESLRESSARIMGAVGAVQAMTQQKGANSTNGSVASQQTPSPMGIDEDALRHTIAALPPKQGNIEVTGRADGFIVDGHPYLDPEGRILQFAFDVVSGRLSYAAGGSEGVIIRTMTAGSTSEPVTIATAKRTPVGWDVQTVTGKRVAGNGLSVTPDGFLVSRQDSAFRYVPGTGVQTIAVPDGFQLAPLQRGNVGATGFVLLERVNATGGGDSAANLVSSVRAIGSLLGVSKKEDFALMDMKTGRLILLNIDADSKQVSVLSQCRKRNNLVNECRHSESVESLYDQSGFRNSGHYYWRVQWANTPEGPLGIAQESGSSTITLIDLATGRRVVAFHRGLGISEWDAVQSGDGVVRVRAKMGFTWEDIADARTFMVTAPPQPDAISAR